MLCKYQRGQVWELDPNSHRENYIKGRSSLFLNRRPWLILSPISAINSTELIQAIPLTTGGFNSNKGSKISMDRVPVDIGSIKSNIVCSQIMTIPKFEFDKGVYLGQLDEDTMRQVDIVVMGQLGITLDRIYPKMEDIKRTLHQLITDVKYEALTVERDRNNAIKNTQFVNDIKNHLSHTMDNIKTNSQNIEEPVKTPNPPVVTGNYPKAVPTSTGGVIYSNKITKKPKVLENKDNPNKKYSEKGLIGKKTTHYPEMLNVLLSKELPTKIKDFLQIVEDVLYKDNDYINEKYMKILRVNSKNPIEKRIKTFRAERLSKFRLIYSFYVDLSEDTRIDIISHSYLSATHFREKYRKINDIFYINSKYIVDIKHAYIYDEVHTNN